MIRSNFSETALFCGIPITLELILNNVSIKKFSFTMPTVSEMLEYNFSTFLLICSYPEDKLKEWFKGIEFKTRFDLMKLIWSQESDFKQILTHFFCKYWQGFLDSADDIFEQFEDVFNYFCIYIAIACGQKQFKDLLELDDLTELTPEERAWKEREKEYNNIIARTKAKAKSENGDNQSMELMIAAVVHDFGLSLQEIREMNYFTLIYFFSLTNKLARYNVDVIAAGNGLLKKGQKHKYWINN